MLKVLLSLSRLKETRNKSCILKLQSFLIKKRLFFTPVSLPVPLDCGNVEYTTEGTRELLVLNFLHSTFEAGDTSRNQHQTGSPNPRIIALSVFPSMWTDWNIEKWTLTTTKLIINELFCQIIDFYFILKQGLHAAVLGRERLNLNGLDLNANKYSNIWLRPILFIYKDRVCVTL